MSTERIIVICASPDTVRDILLAAEELGMISSGEYVFFSIELFTSKIESQKPWHRQGDSNDTNNRAKYAYEALLTVTARIPDTDEYKNFSREVKQIAKTDYDYDYGQEEVNTFVTAFHEAVLLYSIALNETLADGYTAANGTHIIQKMWNRTFEGITGKVTIDENGDRDADYSILDMNPDTGIFEVVANYIGTEKQVVDEPGKKFHWAGGRDSPPPDTPLCGYDKAKCPEKDHGHFHVMAVLSVLVVSLLVGSGALYRYYRREVQLASMSWKIKWEEVTVSFNSKRKRPGSRMSLTRLSITSTVSAETLPVGHRIFTNTAFYKSSIVFLKPIHKSKIEVTRPLLLEIKMIKDLQSSHIVRFIGAVVEPPNCFLVTEYCPRGSLQDILENEQIKLDWMFRYSLMHDLVKGMIYLHNSDVKSHGNLKSSNCLVDSRFALKITDFGLHILRALDDDEMEDSYMFWKRKLWTAPELLRMPNPPPEGSQKGDVYSFAIIAHEIVIREGVFYTGSGEILTPKEIVDNVKNSQKAPFRPLLENACDEEVIHMIKKCWTEDPTERPDFQALKSIIRRLNKDNDSGNILDNLLSRMEQYANNLEALVEERTADYLEEKRKAEDLLYQLLPKSVASQLIRGESVTAEAFDGVTIYFSDIVGFTEMSAESTPMEVVDLLNDLYTCFDSIIENFDVYKVETIGDAYMVVSGLPVRNSNLHAREIARMSLALLNTVKTFTIRHRPHEQLKLRIGLHTGPCAAGVVGLKMPRYCLFGDTVNTASRMESTGLPLKIHLSTRTKEVLDTFHTFLLECRGDIEIKGKGKMTTYWLIGEQESPPPPPTPPTHISDIPKKDSIPSGKQIHETKL
ncbi:atrial natriuretic peptide receptor 1-like [Uloborus diversus]|uniref:atrial natriuretic peptide receptor 1-like n=1 Tax=Uloborus diversus TaxID=327109 RepID=UPI00240987B6|nr:atrial natriuretic peptide receptor 1-like [Uloborus diversus]